MNTNLRDYRRMRIRADIIRQMDTLKHKDESLTEFLNMAVAAFLKTYKTSATTTQIDQKQQE